ncbi:MAG: DUF1007 family protein [Rhodospirillaceae bacterium]|nr:DUF1007 family protein [Rhodospirillaceae bacterium]
MTDPKMRVTRMAALVFAGFAALSAPARAHPHVWVTGATTLHFTGHKIDRVGMRWQFDAFFSQVLMGDFDTNKDGQFDDAERAAMKEQVFTSLKDYGYFTHLRIGGKDTAFERVENFATAVDKGELVYIFDLLPAAPIDLGAAEAQLSLFDPTIYVDIVLGGDTPVTLTGIDDGKCDWTFSTGKEIANADGMLTPQIVKLACKS